MATDRLNPPVDTQPAADLFGDAEKARDGAPVLPLSRERPDTVEKLCDWVRGMQKSYATGGHVPIDPGPMAPHHHAHDDGQEHDHGYGHSHTHSHD